jgi:MFS family permease
MGQGIFQNAGAVFWGIAADRGYIKRKHILCIAAALQGLCTFSLTFISSIPPMWPIRMANGFFLAALRPISNGIVADLASANDQGFYFGLMQGFWSLGLSGTAMIVGPMAEAYFDLPILEETRGWRIAKVIVSSFAVIASIMSFCVMPDVPPPKLTQEEKQQSPLAVATQEIKTMLTFLRYPSFVLMITQGIFGSIPWIVIGNLNLYARLCGFELWTLFWLSAPGLFGVVGGFLGGMVSDFLTKKIGPRGRPLTAMLTVAMGVPLQFIMWYWIEPGSALNNVWVFFLIQALFNLTAVWAQPGCNFPVLGQIVTGRDRNKVMCWEMAFENTMATIIGSNAVPYVIKAFGSDNITYNEEPDLEQARTLGFAQAIMICCPWLICFAIYSLLLWSFPVDVERVKKAELESRS